MNRDYELSNIEFEAWFRQEALPEKYRRDMWYSWRACWVNRNRDAEQPGVEGSVERVQA